MPLNAQQNRDAATILWALAVAIIAFVFGQQMDLAFRHTFFLMVLTVGVILLFRINQRLRRSNERPSLQISLEKKPESGKTIPVSPASITVQPIMDTLSMPPQNMSPEQAREWLDDFLVRQQENQSSK